MDKPTVLVIGLEPTLIDFSEQAYRGHPGLDADKLQAALAHDRQLLVDDGFLVTLCMVDFGGTSAKFVKSCLDRASFDYILVGAGLRLNARNTALFEAIINVIHQHAPGARLCFNTRANDTSEAILRCSAVERALPQ